MFNVKHSMFSGKVIILKKAVLFFMLFTFDAMRPRWCLTKRSHDKLLSHWLSSAIDVVCISFVLYFVVFISNISI